MSLSGISMPQEIVDKFEEDRMGDDGARLVLKLTDDALVLEHDGIVLDELVEQLPEAEPRYIIYDLPVKNRANIDDLRTVFIVWMPMTSAVRKRMMYSSTKSQITSNIRGISTTVQAEEKEELSLENLQNKVNKTQGINNTF